MDRSLPIAMSLTAALGCASTPPKPQAPLPARGESSAPAEFAERYEVQKQRLSELEARVSLLEAEARARRDQIRSRPTETVRIGHRRGAATEELEQPQEPDMRPVIRLHDESPPPFVPPEPPPGIPANLAVVPLPEERTQQVLARAEQSISQGVRAEYRAALRLLREQRYVEAMSAFDAFLQRHPDHVLSDNAVYWQGEAYYAERRYEEALTQFAAVLTRFPDSNKAADSLLKVGLCHMRLGNRVEAARYFERVREQYPNSVAAQSAPREGSS